MLRSRALKVGDASRAKIGNSGNGVGCSNVLGDGNEEGGCLKGVRTEAIAGDGHGTCEKASRGGGEVGGLLAVEAGAGEEADDAGVSGVVALLLGLELEGVFRTVVSFL